MTKEHCPHTRKPAIITDQKRVAGIQLLDLPSPIRLGKLSMYLKVDGCRYYLIVNGIFAAPSAMIFIPLALPVNADDPSKAADGSL